jgi:dihydrofolate reductase
MIVSAIVACSTNRAIGRENQIPWYLPADLRYFKKITSGHFVIMGRKTFESIGRPLPNRTNIVVSRQNKLKIEGCLVFNSFLDALEYAKEQKQHEVFVIGGGEIYRQSLSVCTKIYYTEVDIIVEDATVFFPVLNDSEWSKTFFEAHKADDKNLTSYSFNIFERKNPITVMNL